MLLLLSVQPCLATLPFSLPGSMGNKAAKGADKDESHQVVGITSSVVQRQEQIQRQQNSFPFASLCCVLPSIFLALITRK